MAKDVTGKVVIVTGSAEGLGYAMVDHFLQNSAKLTIILDINEEKGAQAVQTLTSKYGHNRAVFYKCDVTKDLEDIFNKVVSKYGYIDLVINNAGVLNEKNYIKTIDINITAVIAWTMKFYEYMRKDRGGKGGTIINISSIYGYRISPYLPYYHAAKYGVLGFTKSLGHKINFDRTDVRVIALLPGLTYTALTAVVFVRDDEYLQDFIEETRGEDWQSTDFIGKGTVTVFKQAESGEAWLVEGERPAEKLNI